MAFHSPPIDYETSIKVKPFIQVLESYDGVLHIEIEYGNPIIISKKPKIKFQVNTIDIDLSIRDRPSCQPRVVIVGFNKK
jgi:hypothetical protein